MTGDPAVWTQGKPGQRGYYYYIFDGPAEILDVPTSQSFGARADRGPSFREALAAVTLSGPWAQFGVYQGATAKQYLLPALPADSTLYLFDSFEGLPEAWDKGKSVEAAGKYACAPPRLGPRTRVIEGLYADTVPAHATGEPFAFIDLDCDLYQSTRDVLFGLDARIVPGTVLRFDEVFSYPNWREGEFRALQEWRVSRKRRVEWFTRGRIYWAACRVIL